jgi:hypothetical protein
MPGGGGRTHLRGPGGGLTYVDWDDGSTSGVAPGDLKRIGPGVEGYQVRKTQYPTGTAERKLLFELVDRSGRVVARELIRQPSTHAQELAVEIRLKRLGREERGLPPVKANAPSDRRGLPANLKDLFGAQPRGFVSRIKNRIDAIENDPVVDRPGHVDELLADANKALGGYGVEAIRQEGAHVSRYYQDIIGLYVNLGETYKPTLIYDTAENRFAVGGWGDFLEVKEEGAANAEGHEADDLRDDVVSAMARTLWLLAYADYAESDEGRAADAERARSGEDWDNVAPETPAEAEKLAARAVAVMEKVNGQRLGTILSRAARADRDQKGASVRVDSRWAEEFGSDLAMMVVGSGVSWFDDHAEFTLDLPDAEVYTTDGVTLDGYVTDKARR